MKINDFNEAGSTRDAYQRDYDSSVSGMGRPDDHRGLRQELAHETNNIAVYINGKLWKVWAGKGTADSREERAYLNNMQTWAANKSAATGKKWTVGLTGANVSEAASAAVRMQRAADKQRAKSDASLARTPSSIPKKEEPKQPSNQKGVAEGSAERKFGEDDLDVRKRLRAKISKYTELVIKAGNAGDLATADKYKKKIEAIKQQMPALKPAMQGVAEGYDRSNPFNVADFKRHIDSVTGSIMGRAPTNKYQVGQTVKYQMEPAQAGGSGVGKITRVSKSGDHYEIDGSKIVNHYEIKGVEQGVAEGSGKNVVKSIKVGNFRHDLVDTGMGWQVRIYNGDELYDTGLSKNSEQKGLAALEDAVAYTEKQIRTKRQGVAEGAPELLKKEMPTHRHAEKLLAQNGVSKDDPDYHHHLNNTIKYLRQFGNIDLINKSDEQGVAEGSLNEGQYEMMMRNGQVKKFIAKDDADAKRIAAGHGAKSVIRLRGGVPAGKVSEQGVAEATNPEDRICVDVPLFIRLMEYAREDAKSDMDLHSLTERLTALSASGETLGMDSYDAAVGTETPVEEASLSSMRDYFNQEDDNTVDTEREYAFPKAGTPNPNIPSEIQTLINKMHRVGKITPAEFQILKSFQQKTKMNVGIREATEPYAIGMAQAMKSTGDKPPLKKSTIKKAHEIAKKIKDE